MKCKYCFMQDRPDVNITIDEAKRFIDYIISEFPDAEKFRFELILFNEELFNTGYEGCKIKANRFKEDKELFSILKNLNGQYTFMELKKIKDDYYDLYEEIKG
ncbi:MAG: hypothetical protein KJ971_02615 [Firmicutes bacterium]|nr:hypothetical protein [Bacillota bacterium]